MKFPVVRYKNKGGITTTYKNRKIKDFLKKLNFSVSNITQVYICAALSKRMEPVAVKDISNALKTVDIETVRKNLRKLAAAGVVSAIEQKSSRIKKYFLAPAQKARIKRLKQTLEILSLFIEMEKRNLVTLKF